MVICGAGMAGVATAYHLAVRGGIKNIVLIDERPPLSLTSNKGNEGYRNWWPGPDDTMVKFMNRSIDLLEELAFENSNYFQMNRRGYAFLTANPDQIPLMSQSAAEISKLGLGPVRYHPDSLTSYTPSPSEGFDNVPAGVDLLLNRDLIRQQFPFITKDVVAMMHIRRCGWLNTERLGHWLLEAAQAHGTRLLRDRVEGVTSANGRIQTVQLASGNVISTGTFVIAAGPYLKQVGAMLGVEVPVFTELHSKMAFQDHLSVIPSEAPYLIWMDSLHLPWTEAERQSFQSGQETGWLLNEFSDNVRFRLRPPHQADNPVILGMWSYDIKPQALTWPPIFKPHMAEALLRGLARMIPGLDVYFGQGSRGIVDGGYYCKTRENRPLIGPLPVEGAYVIGALSGYGIMGSQAAAELLAAHITGSNLPDYAPAFLFERYQDPAYQAILERWEMASIQL